MQVSFAWSELGEIVIFLFMYCKNFLLCRIGTEAIQYLITKFCLISATSLSLARSPSHLWHCLVIHPMPLYKVSQQSQKEMKNVKVATSNLYKARIAVSAVALDGITRKQFDVCLLILSCICRQYVNAKWLQVLSRRVIVMYASINFWNMWLISICGMVSYELYWYLLSCNQVGGTLVAVPVTSPRFLEKTAFSHLLDQE